MSRQPYLDNCPECVTAVLCPPLTVHADGPDGVKAHYRCPRCLYSWFVGWTRQPARYGR